MEVSTEAIRAMQSIMTTTRSMAYKGIDSATVAAIMDEAEYLPTILLYGEEYPNEFGSYLRHIANKWIAFTHIADAYDAALKTEPQREDFKMNFNTETAKSEVANAA